MSNIVVGPWPKSSSATWQDDKLQFARLLCEIIATQELDIETLCGSMDLEPEQLIEVLDRAHLLWEERKLACKRTRPSDLA